MKTLNRFIISALITNCLFVTCVYASPGNLRDRFFSTLDKEQNFGPYEIDVETRASDTLILRGKVSSVGSVARAGEIARSLDGVGEVRNELVVSSEPQSASSAERLKIQDAISAIKARSDLSNFRIAVKSTGNIVQLEGEVSSPKASEDIEQIFAERFPTRTIDNQLVLVNPELADEEITAQVVTALRVEAEVEPSLLSVKTNHGVVTVSGECSSSNMRDRILTTILNINGVKDVKSELSIKAKS